MGFDKLVNGTDEKSGPRKFNARTATGISEESVSSIGEDNPDGGVENKSWMNLEK